MSETKSREKRIYKPKKELNGAASKVQLTEYKKDRYSRLVFLTTALQTGVDGDGNAKFAWDNPEKEIRFKFSEHELGEIILMFRQCSGGVKFYHQVDNHNNTALEISKREYQGKDFYGLRLSRKSNGKVLEIKHTITMGEAEELRVLFEVALQRMYGW